jgi:hypothetical protein
MATLTEAIWKNLPLLIDVTLKLILALAQGIIDCLPILLDEMPTIISNMVSALIEALPQLIVAAIQLIEMLAFGIIESIPLLLEVVPKLLNELSGKFGTDGRTVMRNMGKSIVDGLKEGWASAWSSFTSSVVNNINGMVASIKKLLGIASPSTLYRDIMRNFVKGGDIGWTDQFAKLKQNVTQSMIELTNSAQANMGAITINNGSKSTGAGSGTSAALQPMYVTVQANVASNIDIHVLAQQVAEEIRRKK